MNLGAKLGNQFERTERVIGTEKVESLHNKCVAVFGVGGVGGYVCEALARAGVGKLVIVDADEVDITNINRQIIALHSTIGRKKTEVMKERLLDINPKMEVVEHAFFFLPETSDKIDFSGVDYICDAVDTVTAKMEIIKVSKEKNIPVISSMGTGNKLNPSMFEITDISKTSVCPLAKVIRRLCKERGFYNVKVLYSKEEPVETKTREPGSISFVPPVAGLMIAGEIIKDLISEEE